MSAGISISPYQLTGDYTTDVNFLLKEVEASKAARLKDAVILNELKKMGVVHPESIIRLFDEIGRSGVAI